MTEKLRLEIPLVLPTVTEASDACVARLLDSLRGRQGVAEAHVREVEGRPPELCVHYDPDVITLPRISELVRQSGADLTDRFGHIALDVEGIGHARRARTVGDSIRGILGVLEANASAAGRVTAEFDRKATSDQVILAALAKLGVYPVSQPSVASHAPKAAPTPIRDDHHGHDHAAPARHGESDHEGAAEHGHAHGGLFGANTEVIFALICGALLAAGFASEKLAIGPQWVPLAGYIAAYFFGGFYTLREAIDNLRLKRFEIDTLMLVAAAGAAALGAWAEGALLLFLFSIGHALEHYAMGRAKRAIEALAELAPDTAQVRRDGQVREIAVEELVIGDTVLVKPHERLSADGFIVKGASAIDQSPVTGESMPVDKRAVTDSAAARARPDEVEAAHRVFAGTINGNGAIEIEVTRRSTDSALAKVVQMVSEAETQKSPTQRFTDRFERIFVPAILALVGLLLFAWVVIDEPFRDSFYRAMAVLVAASPCALAIATPSAVLSGVARAARGGVLIKGGAPLENLGSLTAIAFDKTGTLTEGRPQITDVVTAEGVSEDELLRVAVAVESLSDHPLARAIARDGRKRLGTDTVVPEATDLTSLTGRGVTATFEGQAVAIGKAEMFGSDGIAALSAPVQAAIAALREAGRTTMIVRLGDRDLGAVGLMDTPREAAKATIERLRQLGIERMIMISGDNQKVADAVAAQVGLDEAWGDLMPEDKVEAIRKLSAGTKVAMVGDGVNDAPAMANATVGIAMGAAGSDVALETADVALMSDNLAHLPFAVGLSRSTRAIIRQNVFVSLGVVAVLVPATIFGLGIGAAVAMHEGSTLLVVFNALRLLRYRDV